MKNQNIIRNERGIAFVVEIIIGAVVLGVIGLAVMQYLKNKDGGGGGASLIPGKVTLNGNCELKDTDLCKFVNNWKAQDNYVIAATTTSDGKKSESRFEISGKDKYHLVSSTGGKEEYNFISIGNTTYTKDYADGKWWEQTLEKSDDSGIKSEFEFKTDDETKDKPAAEKTTYKALGKEACGSLKCFKYEVIEPDVTEKQIIWFDDRDYLLRRMQSTGPNASDMTVSYAKPNITVPSPTKKADASQPVDLSQFQSNAAE